MKISKIDRLIIKEKFSGRCAYSGTTLKEDWEVDHIEPVRRNWWTNTSIHDNNHTIENMYPVQKLINRYKGSMNLELFRTWYLLKLHLRLKKLPKNPRTEKGIKRKLYMLQIASYFNITIDRPFNGIFYFETIQENQTLPNTIHS